MEGHQGTHNIPQPKKQSSRFFKSLKPKTSLPAFFARDRTPSPPASHPVEGPSMEDQNAWKQQLEEARRKSATKGSTARPVGPTNSTKVREVARVNGAGPVAKPLPTGPQILPNGKAAPVVHPPPRAETRPSIPAPLPQQQQQQQQQKPRVSQSVPQLRTNNPLHARTKSANDLTSPTSPSQMSRPYGHQRPGSIPAPLARPAYAALSTSVAMPVQSTPLRLPPILVDVPGRRRKKASLDALMEVQESDNERRDKLALEMENAGSIAETESSSASITSNINRPDSSVSWPESAASRPESSRSQSVSVAETPNDILPRAASTDTFATNTTTTTTTTTTTSTKTSLDLASDLAPELAPSLSKKRSERAIHEVLKRQQEEDERIARLEDFSDLPPDFLQEPFFHPGADPNPFTAPPAGAPPPLPVHAELENTETPAELHSYHVPAVSVSGGGMLPSVLIPGPHNHRQSHGEAVLEKMVRKGKENLRRASLPPAPASRPVSSSSSQVSVSSVATAEERPELHRSAQSLPTDFPTTTQPPANTSRRSSDPTATEERRKSTPIVIPVVSDTLTAKHERRKSTPSVLSVVEQPVVRSIPTIVVRAPTDAAALKAKKAATFTRPVIDPDPVPEIPEIPVQYQDPAPTKQEEPVRPTFRVRSASAPPEVPTETQHYSILSEVPTDHAGLGGYALSPILEIPEGPVPDSGYVPAPPPPVPRVPDTPVQVFSIPMQTYPTHTHIRSQSSSSEDGYDYSTPPEKASPRSAVAGDYGWSVPSITTPAVVTPPPVPPKGPAPVSPPVTILARDEAIQTPPLPPKPPQYSQPTSTRSNSPPAVGLGMGGSVSTYDLRDSVVEADDDDDDELPGYVEEGVAVVQEKGVIIKGKGRMYSSPTDEVGEWVQQRQLVADEEKEQEEEEEEELPMYHNDNLVIIEEKGKQLEIVTSAVAERSLADFPIPTYPPTPQDGYDPGMATLMPTLLEEDEDEDKDDVSVTSWGYRFEEELKTVEEEPDLEAASMHQETPPQAKQRSMGSAGGVDGPENPQTAEDYFGPNAVENMVEDMVVEKGKEKMDMGSILPPGPYYDENEDRNMLDALLSSLPMTEEMEEQEIVIVVGPGSPSPSAVQKLPSPPPSPPPVVPAKESAPPAAVATPSPPPPATADINTTVFSAASPSLETPPSNSTPTAPKGKKRPPPPPKKPAHLRNLVPRSPPTQSPPTSFPAAAAPTTTSGAVLVPTTADVDQGYHSSGSPTMPTAVPAKTGPVEPVSIQPAEPEKLVSEPVTTERRGSTSPPFQPGLGPAVEKLRSALAHGRPGSVGSIESTSSSPRSRKNSDAPDAGTQPASASTSTSPPKKNSGAQQVPVAMIMMDNSDSPRPSVDSGSGRSSFSSLRARQEVDLNAPPPWKRNNSVGKAPVKRKPVPVKA